MARLLGPLILSTILSIPPIWVIFRKAGYSPWLSLLVFVPVVGTLVQALILAFGSWPALQGSGRERRI
jgi:uncharacterized membrane protein YhaH (DUF805 family)